MLAIFTQTNNGSCTATPFHTVRNTRSTLKLKFLGRPGAFWAHTHTKPYRVRGLSFYSTRGFKL